MTNSYNEELSIGDRIGSYEILSVLGAGSMGMVYKCRHVVLGRVVAIKTLRLKCMTDDRTQKRFVREAQMANRLNHPNLIGLVDFGNMANNDPYLVMEFVSGQTLFEIMKRERYLIPERAVNLFAQVAEGLAHAHQRGVIHRDLKPANMLVIKNEDGSETVKIVDLGVAKIVHGSDDEEAEAITMTGEVCGSPIYLSPEQCMYQELDARTDIYSLGVCLYECLTGVAPLRGATVYDTIYMHVHDMPRPFNQVAANPDIPKRLEEIVFRCLAKAPKERFDTMASLKHELMQALKTQPDSALPVNVLPPESLFGGVAPSAPSPPKKASGENVKVAAPAGFGKTSGNGKSAEAISEHVSDLEESLHNPHITPAIVKGVPANLLEKKRKSKSGAKEAAKDGAKDGAPSKKAAVSSAPLLDSLNVRTIGLLASLALVFFGFGSVFAYFIIKANTASNPPAIPSAALPNTSIGTTNTDLPAANPAKTSAFVEPNLAKVPAIAAVPVGSAIKSAVNAKATGNKSAAKAASKPAPVVNQAPLSLNDMNNLLDGGLEARRFNSIVAQQGTAPPKGRGGHGKQPKQSNMRTMQQQYHLKPGRYMPPSRPMPTLRRGPMTGGGMPGGMPGGMTGGGMPPGMMGQGMPGGMMGGGMPPGMMGQGPGSTMGRGQMPMQMPPMGGGMPQGGGMPSGGGGFMDKIKAFIASQSGGTIPPPNQQPQQTGGGGGPAPNQQAADQQANLNHEGTTLLQNKQWAAAVQKYEQAYRIDPSNLDVKTMYAYALNAYAVDLNKQKQYAQAAEYAKRAAVLCPDNPRYQKNHHNFLENAKAQAAGAL